MDVRAAGDDPGMGYDAMLTQSATVRLDLGWADMATVEAAVLEALSSIAARS